jgi:hypothetical protein
MFHVWRMKNVVLTAKRLVRETEKALLLEFPVARIDGEWASKEVWLPKSAITLNGLAVEMPAYMARDKGIEGLASSTGPKKSSKW